MYIFSNILSNKKVGCRNRTETVDAFEASTQENHFHEKQFFPKQIMNKKVCKQVICTGFQDTKRPTVFILHHDIQL